MKKVNLVWSNGQVVAQESPNGRYLISYLSSNTGEFEFTDGIYGFKQGAKWQQERMYSEEEVLDILRKSHSIEKTSKMDSWITKWFEQIKKK